MNKYIRVSGGLRWQVSAFYIQKCNGPGGLELRGVYATRRDKVNLDFKFGDRVSVIKYFLNRTI